MTRRHLSTSQRAIIAAGLATLEVGSNQYKSEGGQKCPSTKEAAEQLSVSPMTVKQAKKVMREATPQVVEAVRSGEMTVGGAIGFIKLL